jgi:hypothetical protein
VVPYGPEEALQCGRHVHYGSHGESLAHGLMSATDALQVYCHADNWAYGTCASNTCSEGGCQGIFTICQAPFARF